MRFKAQPKTELTKSINAYKSARSRLINRDFPRVKQFLWKGIFCPKSFCLLKTGDAPIDVIRQYIQNQGNNHNNRKQVTLMERLKAYKFRLYPSEEQEIFSAKSFGCFRKVYNLLLDDQKKHMKK